MRKTKTLLRDCNRVIDYLSSNPGASNTQISQKLGIDLARVQTILVLLAQAGIINEV